MSLNIFHNENGDRVKSFQKPSNPEFPPPPRLVDGGMPPRARLNLGFRFGVFR